MTFIAEGTLKRETADAADSRLDKDKGSIDLKFGVATNEIQQCPFEHASAMLIAIA